MLFEPTHELIAACPCDNGCPSCVGPAGEKSERSKEVALAILERLSARPSLVAAHAGKGREHGI
jgi:DEAD/DEAH box helicase domain-containing protein